MKKKANITKEATVDIICDVCGDSVVPETYRALQTDVSDFQEFGVLQASFGYGSSRDGEKVHFDLCETCFGKLTQHIENIKRV